MKSLSLEDAAAAGADRCGAKATRLSEAQGLGIAILPGRVLSPALLGRHLSTSESYEGSILAPPPEDAQGRRQLRDALRAGVEGVRWRGDARAHGAQLLDALGHPPRGLVVRSSAIVEDGARFSWAGIFETVFCPSQAEPLAEAIRRVWASQWSHTAFQYARRAGLIGRSAGMAVLIQPALAAEVGGVAFSRDPLDLGSGLRLVEATWGLPSSVVDGAGGVDRFRFPPGATSVYAELGHKPRALVLGSLGPESAPVGAARQDGPCLGSAELIPLDAMVARLEAHFGAPQDVEWAMSKGRLYLLQTRPQSSGLSGPAPSTPRPKERS